jgi:hypothetical protein
MARLWIRLLLSAVRDTTEEVPVEPREHTSTLDTASYTVPTRRWFESSVRQRKWFPWPLSFNSRSPIQAGGREPGRKQFCHAH